MKTPNYLAKLSQDARSKVFKRIAFGLHSFEAFRKLILLTCGKLKFSRDPLFWNRPETANRSAYDPRQNAIFRLPVRR